ncbi:MAG: DUF29 domain-containing protein [Microcystaceae cyanobacterium]
MTYQLSSPQTSLYEKDYCLWLEQTIKQLQAGELNQLDVIALIEELQDMGNSEKNALESNLRILLMHLLKYRYQPHKRSNSWLFTIREHRKRLLKAFKKSPSLKRYYETVLAECYQDGRELASDETGLSLPVFPDESPFTLEDVLNVDYLPN